MTTRSKKGSRSSEQSQSEHLRRTIGITGVVIFWFLRILSLPLSGPHKVFRRLIRSDTSRGLYDEFWTLGSTLVIFICIWASATWSPSTLLLVCLGAFPFIRLFDIMYMLFNLSFVRKHEPRSVSRSILLLFVHYVEVFGAFASFYLVLQGIHDQPLFCFDGIPQFLSARQAVYFSIVTAATIGYGDFAPVLYGGPIVTIVRGLICCEVIVFLFMSIVEIPRLITFFPNQTRDKRGSRVRLRKYQLRQGRRR